MFKSSSVSVSVVETPFQYKTVSLGDTGVGKTTIINKLLGIDKPQTPTVGASFSTFKRSLDSKIIQLNIWDTAGQERFRCLAPMYYRECSIVFIVFAINDKKSFEQVSFWLNQLKQNHQRPFIYLIGNKIDLHDERVISKEDAEKYALENKMIYFEVSGINGDNINTVFFDMTEKVADMEAPISNQNSIDLTSRQPSAIYNYCSCWSGAQAGSLEGLHDDTK